jgi:hypothetical protein
MSSSLLAAVTLVAALQDGEASIFSSKSLSATPKWFSGIQKTVAKNSNSQLSERATVVRGGAAPGEETADEAHADTEAEAVVDVQDLYLPGLLDTIITRTNKVGSVVSCHVRSCRALSESGIIHRLSPRQCRSGRAHRHLLVFIPSHYIARPQQVHRTAPLLSLPPKPKN